MSSRNPVVSVVIPTYKHRDYVLLALGSVWAQTFTDFEVIVVNDGSPDDTAELLRPLGQSGRIRYIEQANQGQGAARNRGIAEARGEVVALLDDDDLWPADKLAWQVEALRRHPEVAVVYGKPVCIGADGEIAAPTDAEGNPPWWLSRTPSGDIYPEIMEENPIVSPGLCLIRRSALAALGETPFDPEIRGGCDDWDLAAARAARAVPVLRPRIVCYRVHAGNASRDTIRMCQSSLALVEKQYRTETDPALRARWKLLYRQAVSDLANFWSRIPKRPARAGSAADRRLLARAVVLDAGFGVNKLGRALWRVARTGRLPGIWELWLRAAASGEVADYHGSVGLIYLVPVSAGQRLAARAFHLIRVRRGGTGYAGRRPAGGRGGGVGPEPPPPLREFCDEVVSVPWRWFVPGKGGAARSALSWRAALGGRDRQPRAARGHRRPGSEAHRRRTRPGTWGWPLRPAPHAARADRPGRGVGPGKGGGRCAGAARARAGPHPVEGAPLLAARAAPPAGGDRRLRNGGGGRWWRMLGPGAPPVFVVPNGVDVRAYRRTPGVAVRGRLL